MKYPYQKPLIIAHRGARSVAPENTLLAAQKGYEFGANMWELDVAVSSDGEIVVIHDDSLKRTSNACEVFPERDPWRVHSFTLAELKGLDFGSFYTHTDPFQQIVSGKISPNELVQMKGLKIPTLTEALDLTHKLGWRVNIELKDLSGVIGDASIVEMVVKLVSDKGMQKEVIISSFNHRYLIRSKAADPEITTAALVEAPVIDPIALLQSLGAQAYNPGIKHLHDLEQIRVVREAGYDVNIWTVNETEMMRMLIDAGVSGIFTDFPQLMVEVLKEYER